MNSHKFLAIGALVLASSAAGTAAVGAIGDRPPTRSEASQDAKDRFAAFDRPQQSQDVFRSQSDDPVHREAAAEIAKTSRRVAATSAGEAYAFLNSRNEACFLWRPAAGGVAASDCSAAKNGNAPGILIGLGGTLDNPTVAGLVPKGTTEVTVKRPDGTSTNVPINDGAYVYQGKSPFTITWTAPGGQTFTNDVKPIDVRNLTPVG